MSNEVEKEKMRKLISIIVCGFLVIVFGMGAMAMPPKKHKKPDEGNKEVKHASSVSQLIEAKKAEITGNMEKAEELFRDYISKYPEDPPAYFELARICIDQKKTDDALVMAQKAADLDPENTWYQLYLAEVQQMKGHIKESIGIYEKLAGKYPNEMDYFYQLGALYIMSEKYKDAIHIYDKIEEKAGISEDISIQKEKIYLSLNDISGAQKELENLVAAYPENPKFLSILAEFYLSNKMQDKALAAYKKISDIDPGNPYIHMSMADYYRKAGLKDKAFEELKLGFANPALDIDTKVNILLSFYSSNQLFDEKKDEAYALVKLLVDVHPNDPKSHSIFGDLLFQDKKYAESRDEFLHVITLDSSKYVIWEEVMRLDLQLEKYDHLSEFGKKAIELYPEQPLVFFFTGIADLQLKHYDDAARLFVSGSKLVVNNDELLSQFYMYLGDTYHALEKPVESDKYYQKSLDAKSDNSYVLNNYAYYLSVRNTELTKAEAMAKKAVALDTANSSFEDTYGWVLYRLGKFEEARTWIGKALKDKDGASAEVLEHYGDVMFRLGDPAQALEYWLKAKEKGKGSGFLERKIGEKKLVE